MKDDLTDLVERAQAGQTRSYDALVRRFQDAAVGYARSLLGGDTAAAEDAAQEAFVEAYRCLPTLREPRAFAAWLRRIVFKHCDRVRRAHPPRPDTNLAPLDAQRAAEDPARLALAGERAARVRAAVAALPDAERAVVSLFYLADFGHAAIADFLNVPPTTVKSRLHSARKRLRKELLDLMDIVEETLKNERPSRDERFAGRVADILAEYERQFQADPKTANRALLADARAQLDAALARPPLAPETVRAGRSLLERQRDFDALADMLARYRTQNLSVSEEAWARWWHVWALTCVNRADETVAAQTEFCAWADATFATETPRLTDWWPFEPLAPDAAAPDKAMDASELPIWVLGIPQQANLWGDTGRANDWLRLAENALAKAGRTPFNRLNRFHLLRTISECILAPVGRVDEARARIAQIAEIADEETDPVAAERWRLEERTTMMAHESNQKNAAEVRAIGLDVIPRLQALEQHFAAQGQQTPWWLHTFQHNAAHSLRLMRAYDLSIPLYEKVIASGRAIGYAYQSLAGAVWAETGDRARTLDLLREAAARDDRDILPLMREMPEFANVLDDPEFVQAAAKP